jgi:putative endonuclease
MRTYHVYILASASRVLYTGVTNDIQRRVTQHREKQVPGFSARYNVQELVYLEPFGDIRLAIAREKQIKGWLRVKKIALIESLNPGWRDLSVEWRSAAPRVQR